MNIKKIRSEYGYTQQSFADEIGVSIATVQNWEAGKTIPNTKIKIIETLIKQKSIAKNTPVSLNIEDSLKYLIESNNRIEATVTKIAKNIKKPH